MRHVRARVGRVTGLAAGLVLLAAPVIPGLLRAAPDPGPIRVVGEMPYGAELNDWLRMLVDPGLRVGMTVTQGSAFVYDLEAARLAAEVPGAPFGAEARSAVVDEVNHLVYFPRGQASTDPGCPFGPGQGTAMGVFDLVSLEWSTVPLPCVAAGPLGLDQFHIKWLAADPERGKRYELGSPQYDVLMRALVAGGSAADKWGQTHVMRQIDDETGTVDWELDIRPFGCDKIQIGTATGGFIGRYGDALYAYCYSFSAVRTNSELGFVLKVPLGEDGMPVTDPPGAPVTPATVEASTIPTLPGAVYPILDPATGRLLILTSGRPNGNAVWVLDLVEERFVGVIPSSKPSVEEGTKSVGLDASTGRTYFLTLGGLLVADVRASPLPAGVNFDIVVEQGGIGQAIAVVPDLNRLFVPDADRQAYVVIEDRLPLAPTIPEPDPDRATADVPEIEGKTDRVFSGASTAYGIHVLSTGGATKAINNLDPVCGIAFVRATLGGCVASFLFTSGNREAFLAPSAVEVGSSTGASASAAGLAFPSRDSATDADMRRAGSCFEDDAYNRTREHLSEEDQRELQEAYGGACDEIAQHGDCLAAEVYKRTRDHLSDGDQQQLEDTYDAVCGAVHDAYAENIGLDLRSGTRGPDGRGSPIRTSRCEDFGGSPATDEQERGLEGRPWSVVSSSLVDCDAADSFALARAASEGLSVPNPAMEAPDVDAPLLAVGRATTNVTTDLTDEGIVTESTAVVENLTVGPITIGRIETTARTVARGRTGTTDTTIERIISDVSGPGINCTVCPAEQVVEAINAALGLRVRARIPEVEAFGSPRGAQAVVLKDPRQRASDRAMNDDDTFEAAGLEIVFYNDGEFGRSRLVLHFAGVQAESRYGIFPLPEGGGGVPPAPPNPFDAGSTVGGVQIIREPVVIDGGGSDGGRTLTKIITYPFRAVQEGLGLLVNNPREAAILFVMWGLLGTPIYLAIKRRMLSRALQA